MAAITSRTTHRLLCSTAPLPFPPIPRLATHLFRRTFATPAWLPKEQPRLRLGSIAPNFNAKTTVGDIDFHQWIGSQWAILFSHPADFTPVCTTELGAFAKLKPEFEKRGVKLIGLSANDLSSHGSWIKDINEISATDLSFPIIADANRRIGWLYDMIDEEDLTNIDSKGIAFTIRSVFIIDPTKKIRLIMMYPASTGRNTSEVLRAVDSLQTGDKKGVTTPIDWIPGDDVIVPPSVSTEDAKKKFGETNGGLTPTVSGMLPHSTSIAFVLSIFLVASVSLSSSLSSLPTPHPFSGQHPLHTSIHQHPHFSPTLSLYHYHHSPNSLKRTPSEPIGCPNDLPGYTLVSSICAHYISPQTYYVFCYLPYGPGPDQRISQFRKSACPEDSICVDTNDRSRAHCVKFANFAQKSFQKFVALVTDEQAAIVIDVGESVLAAEAVVTGNDLTQVSGAASLSLRRVRHTGSPLETIWEEEGEGSECESCGSLSVEGLGEEVRALEVGAVVDAKRVGNVWVITEGKSR
ncbi:hypothetical protein MMC13_006063 [Lambiella insularis]|nr:hypothetical protein [Lambiella insularis]